MGKIDVTRTELVWPGKYREDGTLRETPRVNLPFQVIETVNESRATREARKTKGLLFNAYDGAEGDTFEEGWKNKLIWGDNLLVMESLLERFAGKIDLIYIDPPFATGAGFSFNVEVGESAVMLEKYPSIIEEFAYRDTWGSGTPSYLSMIGSRLPLLRELLSPAGSVIVHCDYRLSHLLGALLDEVFGLGDRGSSAAEPGFRNEVVWLYGLGGSSPKCYPKKHDSLLWYSKSDQWHFEAPLVPATSPASGCSASRSASRSRSSISASTSGSTGRALPSRRSSGISRSSSSCTARSPSPACICTARRTGPWSTSAPSTRR